jgi:hypothetical protein
MNFSDAPPFLSLDFKRAASYYFALGLGGQQLSSAKDQSFLRVEVGEHFPSMKTRGQRDLFPGALEMMILRTLKWQTQHGYALAQHTRRTSNDLLQIEEGSLYPAPQRPSQGRVGESRMGHLLHKPSRSDLQIDSGGCEAS